LFGAEKGKTMIAKLCAWYLQKQVKGIVVNTGAGVNSGGWIFGKNWHIQV